MSSLACIITYKYTYVVYLICFNFLTFRSPYWQIVIDVVTVCGLGFKAPNDEELKGPILAHRVADVKVEIEEQRKVWLMTGCSIMTDGWTNRRNRTLLNFLVFSSGNCRTCTYYCVNVVQESILI